MNAFLNALAMWQVDFLVLATVFLAAAMVCRVAMRRQASRVALAWGTWLGLLALAVLTAVPAWPRYTIAELVQPAAVPPAFEPAAVVSEVDFVAEPIVLDTPLTAIALERPSDVLDVEPAESPQNLSLSWQQILGVAWLLAVTLACGWIVIGLWQARRLVATAAKAPAWIQAELRRIVAPRSRLPGLLVSERLTTAVALGAVWPKIVLPQASMAEGNAPAVRAALAHEWAHIRHGDLWLLALERLLVPLLAVHPLFWWLRRSVRLDQELVADAAAAGAEPAEYAAALLALARTAQPATHTVAALSMWQHPSTLSRRVSMILDPKRPQTRPLNRLWLATLIALIVPAILGLSLFTLRPLTAQDDKSPADAAPVGVAVDEAAKEPGVGPVSKYEPVTLVDIDLVAMSVNRDKLASADTTLEDEIAEVTESRCRKEEGLVVADISPAELEKLLAQLKKHDALRILSSPRVKTVDGREAMVRIGGETPVLRIQETVNGQREYRVQFREFGTKLTVKPTVATEENPQRVTLDLSAEQTLMLPPDPKAVPGAVPGNVPSFATYRVDTAADTQIGRSLLVAQSPAKKNQLREEQFMVVVTPQKVERTLAPVAHLVSPAPQARVQDDPVRTRASDERAKLEEALKALQAERDARANENEALKRQLDALQRDLARLRDATAAQSAPKQRTVTRVYPIKHRSVQEVVPDVQRLLPRNANELGFELTGESNTNRLIVRVEERYLHEIERLLEALDRPAKSDAEGRLNDHASALQQQLTELRRVRALMANPTAAEPAAQAHSLQGNRGVLAADLDEARLMLERAEKDFARIEQLKARHAISQQEFDQKQHALELAKIQVRRAMASLDWPAQAATAPAPEQPKQVHSQTEVRLLELDLAEAKLAVEEAEARWANAEIIKQKNPGAVSDQEGRTYRLAVERAKIQVQRIMVKLEAAQIPRNQQPQPKQDPQPNQEDGQQKGQ